MQLLAQFVETYNRTFGVVWPGIDRQHIFHLGDKAAARLS